MHRFPWRQLVVWSVGAIAVCALLPLSGCWSNSAGLVSVSGTIMVDGKPADGAVLLFHPKSGEGPVASAVADATGRFSPVTDLKPGIAPGSYQVTATWPDPSQRDKKVSMGETPDIPDLLKSQYVSRDRTTLSAEITPDSKDLAPFELTTK